MHEWRREERRVVSHRNTAAIAAGPRGEAAATAGAPRFLSRFVGRRPIGTGRKPSPHTDERSTCVRQSFIPPGHSPRRRNGLPEAAPPCPTPTPILQVTILLDIGAEKEET